MERNQAADVDLGIFSRRHGVQFRGRAPDRAARFIDFGGGNRQIFAVENRDRPAEQPKRVFDGFSVVQQDGVLHDRSPMATCFMMSCALPMSPVGRKFRGQLPPK